MEQHIKQDWNGFWPQLDFAAAGERLRGTILETPLVELPSPGHGIEVLGKMENRQVGRAFKARGAWNQLTQLSEAERGAGVVAVSSGNHGMAVAWASNLQGVPCTICMPENSYASKIEGCRGWGAEVVLRPNRTESEAACAEREAAGATLIHPYDAERTIEGAGTVGFEIARQTEPVDLVLLPIGGGGLAAGSSLALRRAWGDDVTIVGVEPEGAPGMSLALERGESVMLDPVTSEIQGLTSPYAGDRNRRICEATLNATWTLSDAEILDGMGRLQEFGEIVEPAGAAAYAAACHAGKALGRESVGDRPFRVLVIVSGGNGPGTPS
ncbi:MAG: pyridoxal-phosphate dependent enzyme [Planctomycetota bacterium]|nr:pyridoxal-phosphate dependent enzyme [Planctomycetota bacterium]